MSWAYSQNKIDKTLISKTYILFDKNKHEDT